MLRGGKYLLFVDDRHFGIFIYEISQQGVGNIVFGFPLLEINVI